MIYIDAGILGLLCFALANLVILKIATENEKYLNGEEKLCYIFKTEYI